MQDGGTPLPEFFKKNPKFEPINPDRHLKWFTDGKFDYNKWVKYRTSLEPRTFTGISDFSLDTRSLRNVGPQTHGANLYYDRKMNQFMNSPNTNYNAWLKQLQAVKAEQLKVPQLTKWEKIKNFLSKTGKIASRIGKVIDPFPFMIVPQTMDPNYFGNPYGPQAMRKGGEGPSVMKQYL